MLRNPDLYLMKVSLFCEALVRGLGRSSLGVDVCERAYLYFLLYAEDQVKE